MPVTIIRIIETEQRRNRMRILGWAMAGVGMIEVILFAATMTSPAGTINLILAINFFAIGISLLLTHREKFFIELTDENIVWSFMTKRLTLAVVDWNDVRWFKKENDNSLTIYKDSSFSHNIDLSFFSPGDNLSLISAIRQTAAAKAIKLVNF